MTVLVCFCVNVLVGGERVRGGEGAEIERGRGGGGEKRENTIR